MQDFTGLRELLSPSFLSLTRLSLLLLTRSHPLHPLERLLHC